MKLYKLMKLYALQGDKELIYVYLDLYIFILKETAQRNLFTKKFCTGIKFNFK